MHFEKFSFGSIRIDGVVTHEPRRGYRSWNSPQAQEKTVQTIPRDLRTHPAVRRRKDPLEMLPARDRHRNGRTAGHERSEARGSRRKIKLLVLPTAQAIKRLKRNPKETNAILHVTC
jgi:hypothetical protein